MSNRATTRALKNASALASILFGAALLAGCSSLGLPTTQLNADEMVTGAIGQTGQGDLSQAMPGVLQNPQNSNAAHAPYMPAANVGGSSVSAPVAFTPVNSAPVNVGRITTGSINTTQLLPPIPNSSNSVTAQALPSAIQSRTVGSPPAMPVQKQAVNVTPTRTEPFPDNPVPQRAPSRMASKNSPPQLTVVPSTPQTAPAATNVFKHTIESGESLYAIARRYGVSSNDIVSANNLSAPDQIFVGQKLIIPGREDLLSTRATVTAPATPDPVTTASIPAPQTQTQASPKATVAATPTPVATPAPSSATPQQVASTAPAVSNADGFRWPVSGRVIENFQQSRRTGINIEAPSGAAVRAAENGSVVYVGDGVSGFGNLVLVRHANGFVSAYAHLKDITVSKGATVSRGDQIGTVGMTGSVNRPQLHFELRQGATPVDPMPLLAS